VNFVASLLNLATRGFNEILISSWTLFKRRLRDIKPLFVRTVSTLAIGYLCEVFFSLPQCSQSRSRRKRSDMLTMREEAPEARERPGPEHEELQDEEEDDGEDGPALVEGGFPGSAQDVSRSP
jgi:hypothetical protein